MSIVTNPKQPDHVSSTLDRAGSCCEWLWVTPGAAGLAKVTGGTEEPVETRPERTGRQPEELPWERRQSKGSHLDFGVLSTGESPGTSSICECCFLWLMAQIWEELEVRIRSTSKVNSGIQWRSGDRCWLRILPSDRPYNHSSHPQARGFCCGPRLAVSLIMR